MELFEAIYTQSYITVAAGVFSKARTLYPRHSERRMGLLGLPFLDIQLPTEKAPGSIFCDAYMQANCVTALLTDRNQHPRTNLVPDACRQALQASSPRDP